MFRMSFAIFINHNRRGTRPYKLGTKCKCFIYPFHHSARILSDSVSPHCILDAVPGEKVYKIVYVGADVSEKSRYLRELERMHVRSRDKVTRMDECVVEIKHDNKWSKGILCVFLNKSKRAMASSRNTRV